jgi:hypothetical protein
MPNTPITPITTARGSRARFYRALTVGRGSGDVRSGTPDITKHDTGSSRVSAHQPGVNGPRPGTVRSTSDPGLRRWGRSGLAVLATAVGIAAVGIVVVTPDGSGLLQPLDDTVRAAFGAEAWRGQRGIVWSVSTLVPLVVIAVGLRARPAERRRRTVVATLVAAVVALVSSWTLASILRRPAPYQPVALDTVSADRSFPSIVGAVTVAALVALVASSRRPRLARAAVALAVAGPLIAVRLATDTSWLLDEIAGAGLGVAAAGVAAAGAGPVSWPRRPTRRWTTLAGVGAGAVGVAVLVPVALTYGTYLAAPGNAAVADRTVEYLRDHGLSTVVDRAESWWLWSHPPATTGAVSRLPAAPLTFATATARASAATTTTATTVTASTARPAQPIATNPPASTAPSTAPPTSPPPAATDLPPAVSLVFPDSLPGEGQWTVAARDPAGSIELATTTPRPDPDHPTLVAAIAWMSHVTTRFTLIAGLREPGGGPGPAGAQIPLDQREGVLAAFNSGYRLKDTPGGALVEGRLVRPLEAGLATAAVGTDGRLDVGMWGRDLDPNGSYAGLRQNLHLLVDGGAVVDGVATNAGHQWGTVKNALPTWRSGLGITASGDIVYAAGNQLSLGVLADVLVRAGAQRAMELDIHKHMVTLNLYSHDNGIEGHKLMPDMTKPANRYLSPDWRDFFMVTPAS